MQHTHLETRLDLAFLFVADVYRRSFYSYEQKTD